MKHILYILTSLVFALIAGATFGMTTGADVHTSMAGAVGLSMGLSVAASFAPASTFNGLGAVMLKQMWETEMLNAFRSSGNWMQAIPRKDQYVGNNVINLTEIGADPTLLINNTSYPIATAARVDDNVALALNKYDTTNTKVTRDEMQALPYDKVDSVIRQHKDVILEGTRKHGLWNLAIAGDSATTPLVETTGADNGSSRKAIRTADILKLKLRLDNLFAPEEGRSLVMCSAHINELLLEDQSFNLRYQNHTEGKMITRYHGFDIYEDKYNPVYTAANAKKAFGAAAAGTDRNASVCFIAGRSFQATGTLEMFYRDKANDPENRETVVGFQLYHIIAPKKTTAFGVIVSDDLA
ncbi:MAG: hypothetical protein JNL05_10535 [Flavobacteriales bacterium]|nr:hypothetical protein [Flavobacteriales bacterium]